MMKKYILGPVICVTPHMLVISEYNYEFDTGKATKYFLNENTKLIDIGSLSELSINDEVAICYTENARRKIVLSLVRREPIYSWMNRTGERMELRRGWS